MADKNENVNENLSAGVAKLPKPKEIRVSCDNLMIDPLNFRFDGSNNELGLNTTSLDELVETIKADRQILRHIVLNKEPDGTLNTLIGGRRVRSAKQIKADKDASAEVVKNMDAIPAYVYEGLTDEQKLWIINDQDQKKFRFTELVKLIFLLFDKGLKWPEVAARVYRQYGDLTGNHDKLNDLDTIRADKKLWEKKLKSWLRGAIDEVYGEAYRIGGPLQKIILTEAAEKDKLIITKKNAPKGTEPEKLKPGPTIYLIGNQKRLDELRKAKETDVAAGDWNAFDGGPAFQEVVEKFRKEDYEGAEKNQNPKALGREALKGLAQTAKSKLGANLLKLAAGDKDADGKEIAWKDADAELALFEAKKLRFLQNAPKFKEEVHKVLYMAFVADDFDQFKAWMAEQMKPAEGS